MKVTVLKIDHKHGANFYVCATPKIAQRVLKEYVRDWWVMEMDKPLPKKLLNIDVEEYFEKSNEFYETSEDVEIITK